MGAGVQDLQNSCETQVRLVANCNLSTWEAERISGARWLSRPAMLAPLNSMKDHASVHKVSDGEPPCVCVYTPAHTLTPMRTFIHTCTDMKKIERYGDT